jgi:hypothetical protein
LRQLGCGPLDEVAAEYAGPKRFAFEPVLRLQVELAHVALVVDDYDEVIAFDIEKLGCRWVQDAPKSETER